MTKLTLNELIIKMLLQQIYKTILNTVVYYTIGPLG